MLKDLYELQKIEVAENNIAAAVRESDAYHVMRNLKTDFDGKKAEYAAAEADLDSLKDQIAEFPAKIQEIKDKLENENKAMYDGSVENLKELGAREDQIAALEDKLQELEALKALYEGEKEQKEQAQAALKMSMAKDYAEFKKAREEYSAIEEENKQKLAKLAADKEAVIATISAEDMAWYEQYRYKCNGSPIARLGADHVCQGCFTIVPPVTYQRTALGQSTYCEKCGRVLFIDTDAEAPEL